jgi:putative transposase
VTCLEWSFKVSQRRACHVVGQPRATQRYALKVKDDEPALVGRMHELVRQRPRFGYRRIWALLRQEGWRVNRKRIWRLWKREGFKVPRKQRKRRRLGRSANGILRRWPTHIDHVWAWDFIHDRDERGRPLKLLPIEDEYTRECLALDVARSITAADVIRTLARLFAERGAPGFIRSDNGPEFIAQAIRDWLPRSGVQTLYIAPGAAWENAYSESLNSRLRDELLNRELFTSVLEAKVITEDYREEYNQRRPHSALGYQTPAAFAGQCRSLGALPPNPRLQSPNRRAPEVMPAELENLGQTLITVGT